MRVRGQLRRRRKPYQQDKADMVRAYEQDPYKVLKTLWQLSCQGKLSSDEVQLLRDRYVTH